MEWLLSQLRQFSQFFGTKRDLFGDGLFAEIGLRGMIEQHLVLIAEHTPYDRVGLIAGWVFPHPFNPKIRTLSETFWWVDEAYRGSRAGLMLLEAFVLWGKANVDWITMSMIEGASPINDACLLKRGFHLHERSYLMEVG